MTFTFTVINKAYAAEEATDGAHAAGDATAQTHSGTEVAHDGGAHGAEGGAFPPFDPSTFASQLLWLAITFAIFYWFMSKVAIPRIASILEVRRDRISGDLDEAQRLRDEADAAHAAYEQELAEARSRAHAIAQDASEKAKAEADARRQKVEADLAKKLEEAEARIGDIRAKAMSDVGGIASETVGAIVSQLVGASATKAEISRAVGAVESSE